MSRSRKASVVSFDEEADASDCKQAIVSGATVEGMALVASVASQTVRWDFAKYRRKNLAINFMMLMFDVLNLGRLFTSWNTFLKYKHSISYIIKNIDAIDPYNDIIDISSFSRSFVERLDGPGLSSAAYGRLLVLIVLLREARKANPQSVSEDLRGSNVSDRLSFISRWPKPKSTPRDPYTPYVASQIEQAARLELQVVLKEMRAGRHAFDEKSAKDVMDLTPNWRGVMKYAGGKSYSSVVKEYSKIVDGSPLKRVPTRQVDVSEYSQIEVFKLARSLAIGKKLTGEYRIKLSGSEIAALTKYSFHFNLLKISEEDKHLSGVKTNIINGRSIEKSLIYLSKPVKIIELNRKNPVDLIIQIKLRVHVLRSWLYNGLPRSKFDTLHFHMWDVCLWKDDDYGIIPIGIGNLRNVADSHETLEELIKLIAALARRFPGHPNRAHSKMLIRKIEYLEAAVLGEQALQLGDEASIAKFLEEWEDPRLGLGKLVHKRTITTHARYGGLVQWAVSLFAAFQISRRRQLGSVAPSPTPIENRKSIEKLVASFVPTTHQLTSFLFKLALMCDIDLGSLKELDRECLRNSEGGTIDIFYRKNRNSKKLLSRTVKDGSLETPGGLIRAVLEITDLASQILSKHGHQDARKLWLGVFRGSGVHACDFFDTKSHPWVAFCDRNKITNDNGDVLDAIQPSRFRKTVKAVKYLRSGGDVNAIADDNSKNVARDHYANLPALAEMHDEAVASAFRRALSDCDHRVLPDLSNRESEAEQLSQATGFSVATCLAVIDGEEDVWLAGCLDFSASPYGAKGEDCPTPFTECLHCPNSVFTARKLPNLLRFKGILSDRRTEVGDEEWAALYAEDWYRLTKQILPRFSEAQISGASKIIQGDSLDDDPELLIPAVIGLSA